MKLNALIKYYKIKKKKKKKKKKKMEKLLEKKNYLMVTMFQ